MRFKDRKVLVTGGSRGIGKAIADLFVGEGANVTLTRRESNPIPDSTYKKVVSVDFNHAESVDGFIEFIQGCQWDICVNNAGINIIKPLAETSFEDFDKVMKVDLYAPFRISQAIAPGMVSRQWGRIVNISSIWSVVTKSGRMSYTSAKSGLVGMTKTLAVELSKDNVIVNSVSPGFTMTDLTRASLSKAEIETISASIPIGRFAESSEIAELVLFMCSEQNTYIVGQNIIADGGFVNV